MRPISTRLGEGGLLAIGIGYLVVLSWMMGNLSYDIWGVMIVGPPLAVLGVLGLRRMFSGDLRPIANVMYLGVAARFAGAAAKYFVSFGVYGGTTDAEGYHDYASGAASKVWGGHASFISVLPGGTGTRFIQRFTSFVYTLIGTSKLAGYFVVAWMAMWGVALFVKAACLAIPGLQNRRYAALCVLGPSIVYWPSSIGKEAVMMLALGIATYGLAGLLSRRRLVRPLLLVAVGLSLGGFVRPHLAGLWLAGLFPALVVALFRGRGQRDGRSGGFADRLLLLVIIVITAVALVAVGSATVRYLNPGGEDKTTTTNSLTAILNETTRRTSEGGSNFKPPPIRSPVDWPFASARTLTRPLLFEAHNAGQLFSAIELTAFIILCFASARRLAHLPRLVLSTPYLAFAMTTLFLGGLAYSSFANLGILTRQKSLVLPLMFLIPCVPVRSYKRDPKRTADEAQKTSTSPSVRPQLDSGGVPASLTARQVRTGPPWGNGAKPAVGRG